MIFWIDEEEKLTYASQLFLRTAGYRVESIPDATKDYETLINRKADDFLLAVIDVMLLPGTDKTRFSSERTEDYLYTGLCLLEDLIKNHLGKCFPQKSILYSRATRQPVVQTIRAFSEKHNVRFIRKTRRMSAAMMAAEVSSSIQNNSKQNGA